MLTQVLSNTQKIRNNSANTVKIKSKKWRFYT